jgi:N-acetylneuraminic acid mutarotase
MTKKLLPSRLAGLLQMMLFVAVPVLFTVISGCSKSSDDDLVGNWSRRSEFEGVGRTEAVTFTIGTKIYVGGGYDGKDRLVDFWEFNLVTGTWYQKADFPGTPRNSAVAFTVNGKAYVGTGYDENDNKLKDFWEFDPVANLWTRKADFGGTARYNAVAFAVGTKGYVGTGYDGSYLKDLWEYDPTSDKWLQKASLTGSKRTEASVFVYNNQAYVVGGSNNGTYLNDFWVYNPAVNTWTEKRKISSVNDDETYDDDYGDNIRRANAVVMVSDNRAYLVCGNRSGIIGTVWQYNIDNDTWKQKTSFEGTAREGALGFSMNNRIFIVTGSNTSYWFDDLWEFSPDVDQDDNDN